MTVKHVWRAVTAEQNRDDRANHTRVIVSTQKPADGDEPIVYEIHAPEDALVETDVEGEYMFDWADIEKYPYQVQHRG
jgi:hypothetical protein